MIDRKILLLMVLAGGCVGKHLSQPVQSPNYRAGSTIPQFVQGTSLTDVIKQLEQQGVTNITNPTTSLAFFPERDESYSAVTGDNLSTLYLFRNEQLYSSTPLSINPYVPRVHGVRVENEPSFLLINGEILPGEEASLYLLAEDKAYSQDLTKIIEKNGGFRDPLFIGGDIMEDMGPWFTARDKNLNPWNAGYQIGLKDGKITIDQVPLGLLQACSCYDEWFWGK